MSTTTSMEEEEQSLLNIIISSKISSCSITDNAMVVPEEVEEKKLLFGEEVIGKRIRIFDEGWVVLIPNAFCKYAFEREDDGILEVLLLKDQMMKLGIFEKEEDIDGKKIRVYDEGVVSYFHQNLGMHSVQLEDGSSKVLILHNQDQDHVVWEWEWEWHLGKSQLPSLKRIWKTKTNQEEEKEKEDTTTTT